MGDGLLELLKQLGGFTIMAQTLVHMSATKKFAPYVRLLVASVTIVILITPILDVMSAVMGNDGSSFQLQLEEQMESYWDTSDMNTYLQEEQLSILLEPTHQEENIGKHESGVSQVELETIEVVIE